MASTNSELVKACGPVSGIRCPTRSSVSSARAATSAMSVSTIGAVEAAAYGPNTTSPARICGDHMPAKFVAKTVGRRLTQAKPESTASCSTSLLRSPRKRDGCREKSSSALIAESATNLVTPARTHWATSVSRSSPSARELRNTADAPESAPAAEPTGSTLGGSPAVSGARVTARTEAPAAASAATRGRPTFPVAPVTTIVMNGSFLGIFCGAPRTGRKVGKLHRKTRNFLPQQIVEES